MSQLFVVRVVVRVVSQLFVVGLFRRLAELVFGAAFWSDFGFTRNCFRHEGLAGSIKPSVWIFRRDESAPAKGRHGAQRRDT